VLREIKKMSDLAATILLCRRARLPSSRESVDAGSAVMRVGVRSVSRQGRVDQLSYLKTAARQIEHDTVALVAQMDDAGDSPSTGCARPRR